MLSIDLSNTTLSLVEGEYRKGKLVIKGYDSIPTPEGSVKNGMITNMVDLAEALRTCIRKNGFKSKRAVITVNSTAIVTREVTVPDVREREMRGVLSGEIEQTASSKQEHVLDYVVLERVRQQDANLCRVLCIVVPKVMVESCRDLLEKQLGLKAHSFDVLTHTVYKYICQDPEQHEGEAIILANVHDDELCLVLAEGETKLFFRTVPINVTRDVVESEYILSAFGGNDMVSEDRKREQIYATTSENISKLMQFQLIKNKDQPVKRVILSGKLQDRTDLADYITDHVGIETAIVKQPDFIQCHTDLDFALYLNAASALLTL